MPDRLVLEFAAAKSRSNMKVRLFWIVSNAPPVMASNEESL